jgi:transposase
VVTGRLIPDHKTIADFRKDNGPAIGKVCARFVALCREVGLLTSASVAIDGSKFKAVNTARHEHYGCSAAPGGDKGLVQRNAEAGPRSRRLPQSQT